MVVGFFDEYKEVLVRKGFTPIDLNEENVRVIFARCLLKDKSKMTRDVVTEGILFPGILGYSGDDLELISFDKKAILDNKKNIEYLFGQLYATHNLDRTSLHLEDFSKKYSNKEWAADKVNILRLLYMGCCPETDCVSCFNHKKNDTTFLPDDLKPTLSPNDPNFPEWWAKHKSEWEECK